VSLAEVERLDREADRIRGLVLDAASGHWRLGTALAEVKQTGIWKYRVGDDGKPAYTNFVRFCEAEIGLRGQWMGELISMSAELTEDQVRRLGPTKATIVAKAAPEKRPRLLREAPKLSARELSARVRQTRVPSNDVAEPAAQAKPTRPRAQNEVTAVFALKRYELPFSAEGDGCHVAALDLMNGVRVQVRVSLEGNAVTGSVEFERLPEEPGR
jgi:hypothetical protein